ncbi:MAG: OsmC family protein [Candidatus Omnitrophica bacterium]|jgi:uncharacterized OsmC-like protein|nr:OsmC family protein [Candidatus Omnitrophota bacterium]
MYKVEVTNSRGMLFKARSGNYEFTIDIKDEGISPPDTLLASLASCMGVYVRKYCESASLKLDTFSVNAEAELCEDKPMRFKQIMISIDLKGAEFDERRKQAIIEFVKNCPVHNTLKMGPDIDIKII